MVKKRSTAALALAGALSLVAAGCGDDDDGDTSSGTAAGTEAPASTGGATTAGTSGSGTGTTAAPRTTGGSSSGGALLWDNGPCDPALEPYSVGIITVFESPVLSLIDQVTALEASVEAFNGRGGVGGHCMELTTCDDQADPNREADCARQIESAGVLATLNDTTSFNPQAVIDVFEPAGLPRFQISPSVQELASSVSYPIGAGGTGTTFMMVPTCTRQGFTKIAAIHVDTPTIGPLFEALKPMLGAYGAELVATIPVPGGTTDFQQFILAAEDAGAECIMLPLGENEALQVLRAAEQLGSELTYSASLGTFGQADVEEFGDFAGQMILNAELPPITASQDEWPILAEAIADLEASGDDELQVDQIKSSPFRSWVAVASFVRVIEDFGNPDDVSREAITAAIKAAKDVDLFGVVPAWTPTFSALPGSPFSAVSQPWYYQVKFDTGTNQFEILPERLHVVNELVGTIDYAQPPT